MELVCLEIKLEFLEFLTKVGQDRIPAVASLIMMMNVLPSIRTFNSFGGREVELVGVGNRPP